MWSKAKIAYWVSTGLFTGLMFFSAFIYSTQTEMAKEAYIALGFPTYIIFFNGTAKVLGSIVLLQQKFTLIKEWAYAGFACLLSLAILAHVMAGDGQWGAALGATVLLATSYISYKKLNKQP